MDYDIVIMMYLEHTGFKDIQLVDNYYSVYMQIPLSAIILYFLLF